MKFKDIPSDWKRATRIAIDIEKDLEHKDWLKLFDLTLGKYGIGNTKYKDKLAEVLGVAYSTSLNNGRGKVGGLPSLERATVAAYYL